MARLTKAQIEQNAADAAALHAEQQAELKRMRAEKRAQSKAAKASVAKHVEAVQPDPSAASIEDLIADLKLPSAKRVLVGFILGIAAAFSVGYGIGMLLAYALAGIMTLTATAWIAFALSVVVWAIAIYASWKIGGVVGGKVFSSVVMPEGLASRSYESVANAAGSAKSKVGGWFSSSKDIVAAKCNDARETVTGAFTKHTVAA